MRLAAAHVNAPASCPSICGCVTFSYRKRSHTWSSMQTWAPGWNWLDMVPDSAQSINHTCQWDSIPSPEVHKEAVCGPSTLQKFRYAGSIRYFQLSRETAASDSL